MMARCEQCLSEKVCRYNDGINLYCKKDYECPHFKNKADFVEVKHGEWKKIECGTICTNCNRVYDNDFEFSYKQINEYFKRCPECGAKMDVSKTEITTDGGKAE